MEHEGGTGEQPWRPSADDVGPDTSGRIDGMAPGIDSHHDPLARHGGIAPSIGTFRLRSEKKLKHFVTIPGACAVSVIWCIWSSESAG